MNEWKGLQSSTTTNDEMAEEQEGLDGASMDRRESKLGSFKQAV